MGRQPLCMVRQVHYVATSPICASQQLVGLSLHAATAMRHTLAFYEPQTLVPLQLAFLESVDRDRGSEDGKVHSCSAVRGAPMFGMDAVNENNGLTGPIHLPNGPIFVVASVVVDDLGKARSNGGPMRLCRTILLLALSVPPVLSPPT